MVRCAVRVALRPLTRTRRTAPLLFSVCASRSEFRSAPRVREKKRCLRVVCVGSCARPCLRAVPATAGRAPTARARGATAGRAPTARARGTTRGRGNVVQISYVVDTPGREHSSDSCALWHHRSAASATERKKVACVHGARACRRDLWWMWYN